MSKSMNAGARRRAPTTLWRESGDGDQAATPFAPRPDARESIFDQPVVSIRPPATVVATAPTPAAPPDSMPAGGATRRRIGRLCDRVIASQSLASNEPVLDVRDFAWTADLRRAWTAIRDEAIAMAPFRLVPLWRDGAGMTEPLARCPRTAAALAGIPALHDAAFAMLMPDTHIPARRGVTKGLITCHLGLAVPRDGGARLRVRDRILRWAEGETLIFDDSFEHEIRNDAGSPRIVLRIRFARPLRRPGQWVAGAVLRMLRGVI